MKEHLIFIVLISFLLISNLVFAYSPEQNVNVTNGEEPPPEEPIRPTGGPSLTIKFKLELLIPESMIIQGDTLEAVLEIRNEGDYIPGDVEIVSYICQLNAFDNTCKEIEGSFSQTQTAIPGQGSKTSVLIKKETNPYLIPGIYRLITVVKFNEQFDKTAQSSFSVLQSYPIGEAGKFVQKNWNTILIILIPTCITIVILTIWHYRKVFTRKL